MAELSESARGPDLIEEAYGPEVLATMDMIGRDDFFGILGIAGMTAFAPLMGLDHASHVLDLGSGIGGPARFLARRYGCRVTGIDISNFNHGIAIERTRAAGLADKVAFLHGDALTEKVPDEGFTHVFGCEAWCYFADKRPLYERAWQALQPGGTIAFVEAACPGRVRLNTEELLGPVRYESIESYHRLLGQAGFVDIAWTDTTELATRDITRSLYCLLTCRSQVVEVSGEDVYFGLMELWAEFLAYFAEGQMSHCGFVARKPAAG